MDEWVPDPVERAIRRAEQDGEFDNLPGAGKPIPDIDQPYDPAWWARRWIETEHRADRVRTLAARVRREVPRALGSTDRTKAQRRLEALNEEINRVNREVGAAVPELDVEALLSGFTS